MIKLNNLNKSEFKGIPILVCIILLCLNVHGSLLAQGQDGLQFLQDIHGVWVASPSDSSFISQLEYNSEHSEFSVQVRNSLMTKNGGVFAKYEGVYFYNPSTDRIEFNTVNNSEIHSGYCEIVGDTLFHYAQINGLGKIKSYKSAIVKLNSAEFRYYASYSESNIVPELSYNDPLTYFRRVNTIASTQQRIVQADKREVLAINEARNLIRSLMKENKIPGLSVSVANKEKVIWSEGFGYADLENKIPVQITTKFRIGSISKLLTALAIGKLLDGNELALIDPVRNFVPYFPEKNWTITIGDLVSHTAGIRDYNYRNGEFLNRKNYNSIQESIEVFKYDSLLFEPGSKYSYTTYGYVLLSGVIEGATGMNFLEYMKKYVLAPLELNNTVPDLNSPILENRARFYDELDGVIVNGYYVDNSNKWAGGGYLSTSYDLALLGKQLLSNQFLTESTKQLLWTPKTLSTGEQTNYGIGLRIDRDDQNRKIVHHGGSSIGGRSFFLIYPDEELVIAITSNLSTDFDQNFALEIAELFLK
jgi:CubicO group peptidase (beta-lactamase class C family)